MLQLAESIQLIKAQKDATYAELETPAFFNASEPNLCTSETDKVFLLSFDKAYHIEDTWVTKSQLDQFNSLRHEIASKQVKLRVDDNVVATEIKHIDLKEDSEELEYVARSERKRGYDID